MICVDVFYFSVDLHEILMILFLCLFIKITIFACFVELSGKLGSAGKSHSSSSSKESTKSSPKTVTKATTTIATTTTTSFSNSTSSRKTSTTITSGGESLITGKSPGRSLLVGNSLLAEKFKKSKLLSATTSPSHTDTNGTSSSASPRLLSPKRKHTKGDQVKRKPNKPRLFVYTFLVNIIYW